jgi:hypothetical protein
VLANHYIPASFEFWPPLWLTRRAYDDVAARAADGRAMRFGFGDSVRPPPPPRIQLEDPPAAAAR